MRFDYVIVGGGSAGCVLANRLSADPSRTVCLVEAGPADRSPLIHIPAGLLGTVPTGYLNWAFETVPQPGLHGRQGYQPRGRTLGGSSAINAMIYVRGHRSDFDDWAALGNEGWGYADVLPYFKRSEDQARGPDDFHATGGELSVSDLRHPMPASHAFVEAALRAGIPANADFNGASQEGAGLYQVTQRDGRRCSSAVAFLRPASGRPNLTVLTRCHAEGIVLQAGRATGVRARVRGRSEVIEAAREVILSAGAFGSPQLLMLSGIGPREELGRHGIAVRVESPGVGSGLVDHVDMALLYGSQCKDLFGITPRTAMRGVKGLFDIRHGRGMLTTNYAEAGAFFRSRPELERPDIQLHFVTGLVDDHSRKLHFHYGVSCHVCVLRPKSRGSVRLASGGRPARPARRRQGGTGHHGRRAAAAVPEWRDVHGRRALGRRAGGLDPATRGHALSPGRDLPHGRGRRIGGRSAAAGSRGGGAAGRGRVRHADPDRRQYQCAGHHGRGEGRRPGPLRGLTPRCSRTGTEGVRPLFRVFSQIAALLHPGLKNS